MASEQHFPLEVSVDEVNQAKKRGDSDFVLLDCREPDEHSIAAIDGALLVPMSQWETFENYRSGLEGKNIVVHCHHGMRSLRVANWLRANGFPNAQSMSGGIDAWSLEIDPSVPRY